MYVCMYVYMYHYIYNVYDVYVYVMFYCEIPWFY